MTYVHWKDDHGNSAIAPESFVDELRTHPKVRDLAMNRTHTYTTATLEVSGTVWDEVWRRLRAAGYTSRRMPPSPLDGRDGIDMSEIALVRLPPPDLPERENDPHEPLCLEAGEVERLWDALVRADTLITRQREALHTSEATPDGAVEDADARAELVEHDNAIRMIRECAELLR